MGLAVNEKLTLVIIKIISYLWIVEVGGQLHQHSRQERGDIIGESLHEGAQAKDPAINKSWSIRSNPSQKDTYDAQGCQRC